MRLVECPHCKAASAYSGALLGRQVRCSGCGLAFTVSVPPMPTATIVPDVVPSDPDMPPEEIRDRLPSRRTGPLLMLVLSTAFVATLVVGGSRWSTGGSVATTPSAEQGTVASPPPPEIGGDAPKSLREIGER